MRTVIVGASTGLGRCIGVALAQRGANVALLARRQDLLEVAAAEAGPGTLAITCDVTDEASCRQAVDEVVAGLGGIDAVVFSTGIGVLRRIEDLDAETWMHSFRTNVVGASLFTAAALPHLAASRGAIAYLSSVSASATEPWPGLAAYTVTKAALDKLVEAWRAEHPQVGFTRVVRRRLRRWRRDRRVAVRFDLGPGPRRRARHALARARPALRIPAGGGPPRGHGRRGPALRCQRQHPIDRGDAATARLRARRAPL